MRAALLLAPQTMAMESVVEPMPAKGEVVIQPLIAGICGTDISFFTGHRTVTYPFILGHEVTGRITALGEGVTQFRLGQRVVVEPNYPCLKCALCRTGRGAVCAQKLSMGVNVPGCFAEQAVVPAEFAWAVPDGISDQDAATIEPLAVSMHGLRLSGASAGDTVAVLGCGVVGLLLILAATTAGVKVIAHDRLAEKRKMAEALGAMVAQESEDIEKLWEKENVSVVFECAGVTPTVELALKHAPRGANVILLGISASPASFVPMKLVREGNQVFTSMIYDHPSDFAHVIDQVAKGILHPSKVVTHTFPFEKTQDALELASQGGAGKIHLSMT